MADKTVAQWLGKGDVPKKNFPKALPLDAADPQLVYGVELEIEHTRMAEWEVPGITAVADGSLRHNGMEYITEPMTFSNLGYCLGTFFGKAKVTAENYSERCSVHVHTNCLDLTFDQLSTVCLLYQTFERLLYTYIGHDRDKNIFCVPWSETNLTYNIINHIKTQQQTKLKQWQKYTGLNLLPLFTQGTIEWRHMHGHHDGARILEWCNLIGSIYQYARTHTFDNTKAMILQLNTNSQYTGALESVFGRFTGVLRSPEMEQKLEDGVLDVKYALLGDLNKVDVAGKKVKVPLGDPEEEQEDDAEDDMVDELLRDWAEPPEAPAALRGDMFRAGDPRGNDRVLVAPNQPDLVAPFGFGLAPQAAQQAVPQPPAQGWPARPRGAPLNRAPGRAARNGADAAVAVGADAPVNARFDFAAAMAQQAELVEQDRRRAEREAQQARINDLIARERARIAGRNQGNN